MWGLTIANFVRAYGTRAIFRAPEFDLVHDRQSYDAGDNCEEGEDDRKFLTWIQDTALPWLRKELQRRKVSPGGEDLLELQEGNYVLRASPQASHGYLYIGAAELKGIADEL